MNTQILSINDEAGLRKLLGRINWMEGIMSTNSIKKRS